MELPPLAYIALFSTVVPPLVGFARFRWLQKDMRLFLALMMYDVCMTAVSFYLNRRNINNLWISHVSNLVEYVILMILFSNWQKEKSIRLQLRASIVVFTLFWIVAKLYLERLDQPTIYTSSVSRVLFCAVSVYVLYCIVEEIKISIFRDPRFWIVAAVLFSSTGDLMFYAFRGLIARLPRQEVLTWFAVHWIIITIVNLIYACALIIRPLAQESNQKVILARPS